MKGPEVLPNRFGDAIVTQTEEELLSKNAGESESDITEKDVSGFPEGALAELNVREQGVDGVKSLPVRATGPLGRSEEVVSVEYLHKSSNAWVWDPAKPHRSDLRAAASFVTVEYLHKSSDGLLDDKNG